MITRATSSHSLHRALAGPAANRHATGKRVSKNNLNTNNINKSKCELRCAMRHFNSYHNNQRNSKRSH